MDYIWEMPDGKEDEMDTEMCSGLCQDSDSLIGSGRLCQRNFRKKIGASEHQELCWINR